MATRDARHATASADEQDLRAEWSEIDLRKLRARVSHETSGSATP